MKVITLDIKDLYVNLPIKGIIHTAKFWLNKNGNTNELTKQTLYLLETILRQNYFQHNEWLFQPEKSIAMGSPISSTVAEIYLQYIEEMYIKQWLDSKEIVYYKRYIDDILIMYDKKRTSEQAILYQINTRRKSSVQNVHRRKQHKLFGHFHT